MTKNQGEYEYDATIKKTLDTPDHGRPILVAERPPDRTSGVRTAADLSRTECELSVCYAQHKLRKIFPFFVLSSGSLCLL